MKPLLLISLWACIHWISIPQASSKIQQDTISLTVANSEVQVPVISDSILEYEHFRKKINTLQKRKEYQELARVYIDVAAWHENHTVMDSSIAYVKKAIDLYQQNNAQKSLAETYLILANKYNATGEYDKASKPIYAALTIYENKEDNRGIANCYTQISNLFYYSDRYSEGAEYAKRAIAILEKTNYEKDLALAYRRLAENQLFLASLEESLKNMNHAIQLYKKLGVTNKLLLACYNGRGNIYKYLEEYDKAIADYNRCYEGAKRNGLESYTIPPTANIGHVYLLQGKYEEALPYNLKAIEIMKRTGKTKNLWENYMHVSNMYRELGDYKNALTYHELYERGHADYLTTIIARMESQAHVKYETAQKTMEISDQKDKIEQQKKIQVLYISVAVLFGIILFGMFFTLKNIRKKRKALAIVNRELDTKNQQNELLLKEIHHRVKNNLELVKSLLVLQSAQLTDKASKEAMLASQNRVQSMGIIHQKLYQGEQLGSIEMKDYFVNLSESVLDTFNADEKVKIECIMDELNLDIDTAVPIGLIVNELLTNSLKYAFPGDSDGKINISLTKEQDQLKLSVSDNGVGNTQNTTNKGTGFGTQLIELLTQQLNGTMNKSHTKGTSVFFTFKNYKTT